MRFGRAIQLGPVVSVLAAASFFLFGVVGAQWGDAACLWLALTGFRLQAWLIIDSSLERLDALPGARPQCDSVPAICPLAVRG